MSLIELRDGECPSCKGQLSFTLDRTLGVLQITAGHLPPSCDWYKAFPDSVSVAKAVGLVPQDSVWDRRAGAVMSRGRLIVIEGGDACGKRTQSEALRQRLDGLNVKVPAKLFSFPRYNTQLGQAIIRHLKRKTMLCEDTDETTGGHIRAPEDALVFQCMMVADKYHAAAEIEDHLAAGGHVVCDRWWHSAYVYGQSDNLQATWLKEVHRLMPKADLNILIDVPAHLAMGRRPVARDRYEENLGTREDVRRLYLETWETFRSRRLPTEWAIIDGTEEIEAVHETIWRLVWPYVSSTEYTI